MQKEFTGIDTTKHPVAKLAKKEDEYKPPTAQFDGLTNQKVLMLLGFFKKKNYKLTN